MTPVGITREQTRDATKQNSCSLQLKCKSTAQYKRMFHAHRKCWSKYSTQGTPYLRNFKDIASSFDTCVQDEIQHVECVKDKTYFSTLFECLTHTASPSHHALYFSLIIANERWVGNRTKELNKKRPCASMCQRMTEQAKRPSSPSCIYLVTIGGVNREGRTPFYLHTRCMSCWCNLKNEGISDWRFSHKCLILEQNPFFFFLCFRLSFCALVDTKQWWIGFLCCLFLSEWVYLVHNWECLSVLWLKYSTFAGILPLVLTQSSSVNIRFQERELL